MSHSGLFLALPLKFALLLLSLLPYIHGAELTYANASFSVTPFSFASISSRSLDVSALARDAFEMLEGRQIKRCAIPGGPICDSIHCCPPGYQCCSDGCCPVGSVCTGVKQCCSPGNSVCGSSCCPSAACCSGKCCAPGLICERGECIDEELKDKVIRFEIMDNNRNLLKNMCNGLRGKNTETLTFRGRDKKERAQTRKDAGCKDGYCADQIARGLVDPSFNSCDEYPPASSLEGGDFKGENKRAINCIPIRENNHQGGKFSGMQSQLRAGGKSFERGDKFVISIDCDKVLGDLVPRSRGMIREDLMRDREGNLEERGSSATLNVRDGERVTKSGNETVDLDLVGLLDNNRKHGYLAAPFGDLNPGTYSARIQVFNGSTFGGFVLDNEGFNFTTNDTGIRAGQTQEYTFSLQYWTPGMSLFLGTTSNKTRMVWNLDGTVEQPAPNISASLPPPSTTGSTDSGDGQQGSPNGTARRALVSEFILVTVAMITWLLAIV